MMALQKVECVSQLAMSEDFQFNDAKQLADFIVRRIVPSALALAPAPAQATSSSIGQSPVPVAFHAAASHSDVEALRSLDRETP
jgi:hypothetical protein